MPRNAHAGPPAVVVHQRQAVPAALAVVGPQRPVDVARVAVGQVAGVALARRTLGVELRGGLGHQPKVHDPVQHKGPHKGLCGAGRQHGPPVLRAEKVDGQGEECVKEEEHQSPRHGARAMLGMLCHALRWRTALGERHLQCTGFAMRGGTAARGTSTVLFKSTAPRYWTA